MKRALNTVLLAAMVVVVVTAPAVAQNNPTFKEEVLKQEKIYQTPGEQIPSGYVIDRSLLAYTATLLSGFDRELAALGPGDRWLDVGAGRGQAVLDYYTSRYDAMNREGQERRGKKAQAVAMSIEDRRTPLWQQTAAKLDANQIQYWHGRRLRDYMPAELGKFQLVTDVFGGFSYTRDLSLFMEKVLAALELNGSFYTSLVDVQPDQDTQRSVRRNAPFLTAIAKADGSATKVCAWLKDISCVAVTCAVQSKLETVIEVYRVQKVCDKVTVPALSLVHYEAGTPPERRFQSGTLETAGPGPR
jgi:SAM-dependent methyltransferase